MTARVDVTSRVGMIVFLGSWAMSFVALLFAFGAVREAGGDWPPAGLAELPSHAAAASSLVVLLSSAALAWGLRTARVSALAFAVALTGVFLWMQARLLIALATAGFDRGEATGAMISTLAGFHALHAAVGAAGLAVSVARAARRRGDAQRASLRLWSMFWHFVGAAWLAIYLAVFVA
jgi:heme/copper-type cytochrome/quinol oxidase subunit 3